MRSGVRGAGLATTIGLTLAGGLGGCEDGGRDELDVRFDIPRGEPFAESLSDYGLFQEPMAELVPVDSAVEYELASPLFTDYSRKQRLLKLPAGETMEIVDSVTSTFPEGTVVAKTFYYPHDFTDPSQGWRVIETRLLVMREGQWNVATYVWNGAQTDAVLALDGSETPIGWMSESGAERSTDYEIPSEVACVTCHQQGGDVALIGLRPRNLNIEVTRDGVAVNQLEYLASRALLSGASPDTVATVPAYEDGALDLESRARGYLDANCAHCHRPDAWKRSANQEFDFRYETPLEETGILDDPREVEDALVDGEMPYTGTTLIHDEGVGLVVEYLNTL